MWEHVNPHLFFYIFLPLLIFAEAMRLNINLAVRILPQVLLMAVPGVVLGTALTGAFAKFMFPYGWNLPVSLLFGSILAATDPVAVVALFNTLGVSPRLTMLISGESLLNDGTAIVAFGLMMLWSTGKELTATLCTVYFFKMTLVSLILGCALAWIAILTIGWCAESNYHTDAMIQVCVTIILSMLCFFIAEAEVQQYGPKTDGVMIGTSGVLTVVSAGFLVSHFAWPRFVSRETMHVVWEAVEFIGNTVVFFLAGLLWGSKVLHESNISHIGLFDLVRLLELYVALHVIRAVIILVLWPFFNLTGQPVHWKEALVMTWSGLRGAVGLILAIIVDDTPQMLEMVGTQFLFHIGGIAMLTISVNATLAPILLRNLGLTRPEELEERITEVFEEKLQERARTAFEEDTKQEQWAGVTMAAVEKLVPEVWGADGGHHHKHPAIVQTDEEERGFIAKQGLRMYREAFLRNVRSEFWKDIEEGTLPKTGRVARILLFACEYGLLKANDPLADWDMVEYKSKEMRLCPCINSCLGSTWPFKNWDWVQSVFPSETVQHVWKAYLALCFIEAHKSAREKMPKHLSGVICADHVEKVRNESEEEVKRAQAFLDELDETALHHVRIRMVAGQLLHLQTQEVNRYVEHGVLDDKAAGHLRHELEHQRRLLADANYFNNNNQGVDPSPRSSQS
jgi:NhaP-type Na+/H+ or K+/H+ antiporter